MSRSSAFALTLLASSLFLAPNLSGHGGTYRGPGDVVPGGGGGHGGGGTPPGPTGVPTTGSPTGAGNPTGAPGLPGVPTGGVPRGLPSTPTGSGSSGPDLTTWEFWWAYNKEPYLQLRAAVAQAPDATGDFFGTGSEATLLPSRESVRDRVVPALEKALATERSNDIVTGALIALGRIGDVRDGENGTSELVPLFLRHLSSSSQEIAETAAIALGILGEESAVQPLRDLMLDTRAGRELVGTSEVAYRTRAFAAYGLGLVARRAAREETRQEVVRALVEVLSRPVGSTRDLHVAALISVGLAPLGTHTGLDLAGENEAERDPSRSRSTQIDTVLRVFADARGESLVRAHAPRALAALVGDAPEADRERVARRLVAALDTHSKERDDVQQSCAQALGRIGRPQANPIDDAILATLRRVVGEGDTQSRAFALIALGQIAGRVASGEDESVSNGLRDFLSSEYTRGRTPMRPWAALALGVCEHARREAGSAGSQGVREILTEGLRDARNPELVGATAIALGLTHAAESASILRAKLAEASEPTQKGYLCVALGLVGDRDAVPVLRGIVTDSKYSPELLRQAVVALGLLSDKKLVPELVAMLENAKALASQAAVASALGYIGDARSVAPLLEMLARREGVSDTARGFAAVALGIVADKELLPWNAAFSVDLNYRAATTTLVGQGGTGILEIL